MIQDQTEVNHFPIKQNYLFHIALALLAIKNIKNQETKKSKTQKIKKTKIKKNQKIKKSKKTKIILNFDFIIIKQIFK